MRAPARPSVRRTATFVAGLFVYLLGTNYCMVTLLPGAERLAMSCMPRIAGAIGLF